MHVQIRVLIGLVLFAALAGCQPAVQVASSPSVESAPTTAGSTSRMLVAIAPDGEKAWFLKVVGPLADIDARAEQFDEFCSSLRLAPERPHPDWRLPAGWSERPGTGLRAATILIPNRHAGTEPLELTVMALPWAGTADQLMDNVNRWRSQMQLEQIAAAGLAECTRELKAGDTKLTIVDLRGRASDSDALMLPVANRREPSDPIADFFRSHRATAPRSKSLPTGHPPVAGVGTASNNELKCQAPDGWQEAPASGIRKAAFRVADGAREAHVTVIDFPAAAGPLIGDPLANVNRWRSEVGLDPLSDDELSGAVKETKVDGLAAVYTEAIPPEATGSNSNNVSATLAAMATGKNVVWFFKITGDRSLVAAQRDQFKAFLETVRLTEHDAPGSK